MLLYFLSACVIGEEGVIAAGRAHSGSLAGPLLAGPVHGARIHVGLRTEFSLECSALNK